MEINLLNDWALFKSNLRSLIQNRRMTNIPYFFSLVLLFFETILVNIILILGVTEHFAYKGILSGFDKVTLTSNYELSNIKFLALTMVVNLISLIVTSEVIRRRLNDFNSLRFAKWFQWLFIIINILGLLYWFSHQSIQNIDLNLTLEFYVLIFYQYATLAILALLPSSIYVNKYGAPKGAQIQGDYVITYAPFWNNKIDKRTDFWDNIGLSFTLDYGKNMFWNKLLNFVGRAKRGELYWGVVAFQIVTTIIQQIMIGVYDNFMTPYEAFVVSSILYAIAWSWYAIANISCSVRRLHDTGNSGYWVLGLLVPFINIYVSYMLICKPSMVSVEEGVSLNK